MSTEREGFVKVLADALSGIPGTQPVGTTSGHGSCSRQGGAVPDLGTVESAVVEAHEIFVAVITAGGLHS